MIIKYAEHELIGDITDPSEWDRIAALDDKRAAAPDAVNPEFWRTLAANARATAQRLREIEQRRKPTQDETG